MRSNNFDTGSLVLHLVGQPEPARHAPRDFR